MAEIDSWLTTAPITPSAAPAVASSPVATQQGSTAVSSWLSKSTDVPTATQIKAPVSTTSPTETGWNGFSDRLGQLGAEFDVGAVKSVGSALGGLQSVASWLGRGITKAVGKVTGQDYEDYSSAGNVGDALNTFADKLHTGVAPKDKTYLDNVFTGLGSAVPYVVGGAAAGAAKIPALASSLGIGGLQALGTARDDYHQMVESGDKNAPAKAAGVFAADLALNTVAHYLGPLAQGGEQGILPSVGRVLKSTLLETANFGAGQTIVSNVAKGDAPFKGVWDAVLTMAPVSVLLGGLGEARNSADLSKQTDQINKIITTTIKKGGTAEDAGNLISKLSGQPIEKIQPKVDAFVHGNTDLKSQHQANIEEKINASSEKVKNTDIGNPPPEEVPPTQQVTDLKNNLTDIGYSSGDISRIISDLHAQNPSGNFTDAEIENVKQDYVPKAKDVTMVTSDLTKNGYTPEQVHQIVTNLYKAKPDGDFLKADINKETQALKGEDLYKPESVKAQEAQTAEEAKTQATQDKTAAKLKASQDKADAKVKAIQEKADLKNKAIQDKIESIKNEELKSRTAVVEAANANEIAKGKHADVERDHQTAQKEEAIFEQKLSDAQDVEARSRVAIADAKSKVSEAHVDTAEAKSKVAEAQLEKTNAKTKEEKLKAAQKIAKAKIEVTEFQKKAIEAGREVTEAQKKAVESKVSLENAKRELRDAQAKTKSLKSEVQKEKTNIDKAQARLERSQSDHSKAQEKTRATQEQAKADTETIKTETAQEHEQSQTETKAEQEQINREGLAETIKSQGGTTKDIKTGNEPTEGFSYAPSKDTELSVPFNEFSDKHIDDYVEKHYTEINKEGAHFGAWHDINTGNIVMDVSKVIQNEQEAVTEGLKNNQDAIYDIKTGQSKYLKDYSKNEQGVYTYNGNEQGGNESGNKGQSAQEGSSKVGKSVTDANKKLAEAGFKALPEEQQAKYNSFTEKKLNEDIAKIISDKERFTRIATGDEPMPQEIKGHEPAFFNVAETQFVKDGDFESLQKMTANPDYSLESQYASGLRSAQVGRSTEAKGVANDMKLAQDVVKGDKTKEAIKNGIIKSTQQAIEVGIDKETLDSFLDDNSC
jgi:hypothetical protein